MTESDHGTEQDVDFAMGNASQAVSMPEAKCCTHRKRFLFVKDVVHGNIELNTDCKFVFNSSDFQRLRRLKQLGIAEYVYPAATHNRFAHSLGVAHLAGMYTKRLREYYRDEVNIEDIDIIKLQIAGLCHDLGHGPFSHMFEHTLLPRFLPSTGKHKWAHEDMSVRLYEHIVDNYYDEDQSHIQLTHNDHEDIKNMIRGTSDKQAAEEGKTFLFDIVANHRNGIDVDKLDYLKRDSHYTGVSVGSEPGRIMALSRVVDDQICYKYTEYKAVSQVFMDRAEMHSKVYSHRKVKAVELMVMDALSELEDDLKLASSIDSVEEFLLLDDSIYSQAIALAAKGGAPRHNKARELLHRIDTRQLYKYIDEVILPASDSLSTPRPEDITTCQSTDGLQNLSPEDVVVCETLIDHGMKWRNPMDRVRFCDLDGPPEIYEVLPEQVSSFIQPLNCYQERRIRIYSKCPKPETVRAVATAFKSWYAKQGSRLKLATPAISKKRAREGDSDVPAVRFNLGAA